jgi:hypothetical protein
VSGLWDAWKRVARRIGDVQAPILLTLFYYVALGPFALDLRIRGGALALTPGSSGGWRRREEPGAPRLDEVRRPS